MIALNDSGTIKGVYNGEDLDYDYYSFSKKTALSTQDINVIVDFKNEEITGDCVAYGSWYDIDFEDCVEFIEYLNENSLVEREFTELYEKEISKKEKNISDMEITKDRKKLIER